MCSFSIFISSLGKNQIFGASFSLVVFLSLSWRSVCGFVDISCISHNGYMSYIVRYVLQIFSPSL